MIVMIVLGAVQANAQSYVEGFAGSTSTNKLPEGWGYIGSLSKFEIDADRYHTGVGEGKKAIAVTGNAGSNTDSYLVTPKIAAGPFLFYLRQYSKNYTASAKVFYCSVQDGKYVLGEQIGDAVNMSKVNTPSWSYFTFNLASDSRVAILFNGILDDFVATMGLSDEPDVAEPIEGKHLEVTGITRTSAATATANESNKFSAAFKVTVRNAGTEALTADEVSVSLTNSNATNHTVYATAKATKGIAAGESVDIAIEATDIDAGNGGEMKFYAKENIEKTFCKTPATVTVTAYIAKFAIYAQGATTELSATATQDFGGKVTATVTKNFEIRNGGIAPLEVTSITVPEGYAVEPASFTVAAGDKQTFSVSLVPQEGVFGTFSGNVVIAHSLGEFSFPVSGTCVDPDDVMIDFEDGKIPTGWTNDYYFQTSTYLKYGYVGTSTVSALTSPRIVIKEGKKLSFKAEKGSSYYAPQLVLYYSANGRDWTVAKDYTNELTANFQTFVVDGIPAGKWFIKFSGKYFDIDDITGFGYCKEQLVPIAIGSTGYATFAPQQNVTLTEDINAYIVKSYNNGEAYVAVSPITGVLAKGEGIIVEGEPNTIIDVETTEETAEKNAENILVGTLAATTLAEGEAYILAEEEGQAVFSLCAAGNIAAGKAYLPAPANAAPALKIVKEDDATAIKKTETSETFGTSIYNLAGQKVSTDYKGIIIRNGKKMMVK